MTEPAGYNVSLPIAALRELGEVSGTVEIDGKLWNITAFLADEDTPDAMWMPNDDGSGAGVYVTVQGRSHGRGRRRPAAGGHRPARNTREPGMRELLQDAWWGLSRALILVGVLLLLVVIDVVWQLLHHGNEPLSCQVLGGSWSMFTGWNCN